MLSHGMIPAHTPMIIAPQPSTKPAAGVIATFVILKVISLVVPLRMDEATLKVGDDAVHGETAYAIGIEGE